MMLTLAKVINRDFDYLNYNESLQKWMENLTKP